MSLSEQVRDLFDCNYVSPARSYGQRRVQVAVNDISREFGWTNRFPLICSALAAESFHDGLGVQLLDVTTPCPSSTTVLTFAVNS